MFSDNKNVLCETVKLGAYTVFLMKIRLRVMTLRHGFPASALLTLQAG